MKPIDQKSDHPDERDHDKDLEQVFSAMPELEATEPPEMVDQAVLNMARRVLERRTRRRPMRWLGAFATATVVLLSVSIVLQQDPNPPAGQLPSSEQNGISLEKRKKQEADGKTDADISNSLRRDETPDRPIETAAAPVQEAAVMAEKSVTRRSASTAENSYQDVAEDLVESEDVPAPEEWIERLLLLHQSGLYEKLEEELAAFRQAYPDHPLPPQFQD
jgi:hypothetical protein